MNEYGRIVNGVFEKCSERTDAATGHRISLSADEISAGGWKVVLRHRSGHPAPKATMVRSYEESEHYIIITESWEPETES